MTLRRRGYLDEGEGYGRSLGMRTVGIDSLQKGEQLFKKDVRSIKVGDVLIEVSHQFKTENVLRVVKVNHSGSPVGFTALFVKPDNPREKRMPTDGHFFVHDFMLDGNDSFYYRAKK